MSDGIKLIVGLGNPGAEYANTRHNVGAWFVARLADQAQQTLRKENKFYGLVAKLNRCWLLKPTTFMNESGQAVAALAHFYKIQPQEILIAHDELDFPTGKIRLKEHGGHGGHNGLRNIIQQLGTVDFYRLRIGIGHPGHKDRVTPYVLSEPSKTVRSHLITAIDMGVKIIPDLIDGKFQQAMQELHG